LRKTMSALIAALAAAAPAQAAPSVTAGEATADGPRATVSGTVAFPAIEGPQSVLTTTSSRTAGEAAGSPAGQAAGLDLRGAQISRLPDGKGLRFQWVVQGMPAQTPPEGVRYLWGFSIGTSLYQLSAKRTNVANINTTENPPGTVTHAASNRGFFELRGDCTASYNGLPLSGCFRLAFLDGSFDPAKGIVTVDLPYGVRPDIQPGAVIAESTEGSVSGAISASFQAIVSTAQMATGFSGVSTYFSAPQLALGVGRATSNPASVSYTSTITPAADGTFTGSVGGVTAQNRTVFVRACNGVECAYAKRDLP
jgi:hypothetical protein